MKHKSILKTLLTTSMLFSGVAVNGMYVFAKEDAPTTEPAVEEMNEVDTLSIALDKIETPIMQEDGTIKNYPLSETLRSHLTKDSLAYTKDDEKKTFTIGQQLNGVFLTSDYVNGASEPGISYYNMMNLYATLLQAQQLLADNEGYTIVDSKNVEYDEALIDEFVGLVKQINDFDPTTNLQYDTRSTYDSAEFNTETYRGGTDVIATSKEGNISFEFHIDSHSWWGYDLGAHDSITGLILGEDAETAQEQQHELTMKYGQFFVIKMKENDKGTWYMLNGTDLENPMMYVSADGKEAFMIDVDFYGAYVLNSVIKSVIGENCESLKIFCTHNHGDHVNNLAVIGKDDALRNITTIVWPENEPHTILTSGDATVADMVGKDLVSDIAWKSVETLKDMQKFTVANTEFQFIEIPNEHTPGGGQLADLTNKVIYSGDSLGAQVHLGGTTIQATNAQQWLDGAKKATQYIEENGIQYNIGGHTPYLNNAKFATWLATGIEYAMANATDGYNLIVVENGKVINGTDRFGEVMTNGLTDREELNICSLGYIKQATEPEETTTPEETSTPEETKEPEATKQPETTPTSQTEKKENKKSKTTNTSDTAQTVLWTSIAGIAVIVGIGIVIARKKLS